jgi:putative FmdB family regulatory protein
MPVYEYKCRECGGKFEKLVRSPARPAGGDQDLKCPVCLSPKVERQVSLCGCLTGSGGTGFGAESAPSGSCAPAGGG